MVALSLTEFEARRASHSNLRPFYCPLFADGGRRRGHFLYSSFISSFSPRVLRRPTDSLAPRNTFLRCGLLCSSVSRALLAQARRVTFTFWCQGASALSLDWRQGASAFPLLCAPGYAGVYWLLVWPWARSMTMSRCKLTSHPSYVGMPLEDCYSSLGRSATDLWD